MSYSIIQADIENQQRQIESLWERNFEKIPEGRYQWIYKNNPAGAATSFLLHHDRTNAVVGAISLFPRVFYLDGKAIPAAICGDFVVDREHRLLGPALKLLKAAIQQTEKSDFQLLVGFPNKKSEPLMKKVGFEVLGEICEMTQVLQTFRYIKRYTGSSLVSRIASVPLDFLIRLWPLNFPFFKLQNNDIVVSNKMVHGFDRLWDNLPRSFSFIGKRDANYLEWRFLNSPYGRYHVFTISQGNEKKLSGYMIFGKNQKRIQVFDIGFKDEQSLTILLSSFSKCHRYQGIESISLNIAGPKKLIKTFKKSIYSVRSAVNKFLVYPSSENKEITRRIKNGNWYITASDNDI